MLYGQMAARGDTKQMHIFGGVMKKMMAWFVENKPELAEDFIEELCAIRWRQYLTKGEAVGIVRGMEPAEPWGYEEWEKFLTAMNLEREREGVFNRYALWVAMNQVYTDFGEDTARMLGEPLDKIAADTIVPYFHDMAVSLLTDRDGKYCIRKYHLG